jgi:3-methyladenine DNA glycosylase AlkD
MDIPMTAKDAQRELRTFSRLERVESTAKFFKAYPGGYSEGDFFLSCGVPATRGVAKQFAKLSLDELDKLITSKWHDDRLLALFILVGQYKKGSRPERAAIYDFYIAHKANVNNWDLVDSSAQHIVGPELALREDKLDVLRSLAHSESIWDRRIAMIATFAYIMQGEPDDALLIAEILLHDDHDLIQKAVGWMLREIGKRVSRDILLQFLDTHAGTMPRTTLRYAIEHLTQEQRAHYMTARSLLR